MSELRELLDSALKDTLDAETAGADASNAETTQDANTSEVNADPGQQTQAPIEKPKEPLNEDRLASTVSALAEVANLMKADHERRLKLEEKKPEPKLPTSVNPRDLIEDLFRDPKGTLGKYGREDLPPEDLAGSLIADSLGEESDTELKLRRQLLEQKRQLAQLQQLFEEDKKERSALEEKKRAELEQNNYVDRYKQSLRDSLDKPEFQPLVEQYGVDDATARLFDYASFLSYRLKENEAEPTPEESMARYMKEMFISPPAKSDNKGEKQESTQTQALNLQGDQAGSTPRESETLKEHMENVIRSMVAGH